MENSSLTKDLRHSSLGVKDIVFFVISAAAPLGATVAASPVIFSMSGDSAPLMFFSAAVVLLLFSVGLAAYNRHRTSAGGFATLVKDGIGKTAGYAAAGIALVAYISLLAGIYGQFAAQLVDVFRDFFQISIAWPLMMFVSLLIVLYLGYRDINLSAKILGVLMVLEVAIIIIFDVMVILKDGVGIFQNTMTVGIDVKNAGVGMALVFALACFAGFESTTIYGEEARDPHKTIPRATYIAVLSIGVFYILTCFCLKAAYVGGDVKKIANDNMLSFVFDANTAIVGEWSTSLMKVFVVTSVLATLISFHNALCRYIFSLARDGFLSEKLSAIHEVYKSPFMAGIVLTVIISIIMLGFTIIQADPYNIIYMWMVGVGTLGLIVLQALGAFSIAIYFIKNKNENIINGVFFPMISGIALAAIAYYAYLNFSALSGTDRGFSIYLPWLIPVAVFIGIINGYLMSVRKKEALETEV